MIEEVTDSFKSSPKKNKWLIPAIGVVGLMGLYALFRGGGSGGEEVQVVSDGYASPGLMGEVTSNRAYLEELTLYMERLEDMIEGNTENIEKTNEKSDKISDSLSVIADMVTDIEGNMQTPKDNKKDIKNPDPKGKGPLGPDHKKDTKKKIKNPKPPKIPFFGKTGYKGVSIVDYLKSAGKNSSYDNRKKLAGQLGIKNYKGTASQNTQMLKKLRGF